MSLWLDDELGSKRRSIFQRNGRAYIGPLLDVDIDRLMSRPEMPNSGLACFASNGSAQIYLTMPSNEIKDISIEQLLGPERDA